MVTLPKQLKPVLGESTQKWLFFFSWNTLKLLCSLGRAPQMLAGCPGGLSMGWQQDGSVQRSAGSSSTQEGTPDALAREDRGKHEAAVKPVLSSRQRNYSKA